jgi:branched-chain amino acid transport system substrate-binding protein
MWPNDAGGISYADAKTGFPPVIAAAGLKLVDPGRWEVGTEDYTAEISMFKKNGCEIIHGLMTPPDATNFLKQAKQQSFNPIIMTIDKALLFPEAAAALGDIAINLTCGGWWNPEWPYKSSLTGETGQQFADEYVKRTKLQWTQPLMHYTVFEMANWAFQNATDPTSKDAIIAAVEKMKLDTIGGHIDFSAPVTPQPTPGPGHVHPNCYKSIIMGTQWIKGAKAGTVDLVTVDNTSCPDVPTNAKLLSYATS